MTIRLSTAEQMRTLDRRATEEFAVPSIVLMENAGIRTFDVVYDLLAIINGNSAVIVCGKGNNGGDGFVVARHLYQTGADVTVMLLDNAEDVKGDALVNLQIVLKTGIPVVQVFEPSTVRNALRQTDIVVDALFGTGIKGEIYGLAEDVIDEINSAGKPVVAVDLPSGLNADTGQVCGRCVRADHTVTFALPKLGLAQYPGALLAGEITVADIGIPEAAFETSGIASYLVQEQDVAALLPQRPRDAHKGTFGRVAIIAGSVGLTGAAAMSSMSAVRIGAGLVTLGVPASLNDILETKLTEAMTVPMPETEARSFSRDAIDAALKLISKCDAVAIGPGIGTHPETIGFVRDILPQINVPTVIDADGLNAVAEDTSIFAEIQAPVIITPHPGEMSRLTGTTTEAIQSNRLRAALDGAVSFNATVVLKGAATVIASPNGDAWVNPTGSAALASGGTGDILTGAIVGLIAQGLSPEDAAICGVYVHGRAGELAEEQIGDCGVAATDLLALLPLVIDDIRKGST